MKLKKVILKLLYEDRQNGDRSILLTIHYSLEMSLFLFCNLSFCFICIFLMFSVILHFINIMYILTTLCFRMIVIALYIKVILCEFVNYCHKSAFSYCTILWYKLS